MLRLLQERLGCIPGISERFHSQTEDSDEPSDDLSSTKGRVQRKGYPPYFDFRLFQKGMVDLQGRLKKFDKQSTRHRKHRDVF